MRAAIPALALGLALAAGSAPAAPGPVRVVAAESVYGELAGQIAGPDAAVASILANPDQDPHLFEAGASVARALSSARIVVSNGLGYDPWLDRLAAAARAPGRVSIVAADLTGHRPGDNPHVWYETATMLACARALSDALADADPEHADAYRARLDAFGRSVAPIQRRIAAMRARYAGTQAAATEPVFGYVLDALGMQVRDAAFQLAVMNGTEPAARDVAGLEDDLRARRVRLLVYNAQASDPAAARLARLARESGVPVLGAAETEPRGASWQAWITSELDAVDRAMAE